VTDLSYPPYPPVRLDDAARLRGGRLFARWIKSLSRTPIASNEPLSDIPMRCHSENGSLGLIETTSNPVWARTGVTISARGNRYLMPAHYEYAPTQVHTNFCFSSLRRMALPNTAPAAPKRIAGISPRFEWRFTADSSVA